MKLTFTLLAVSVTIVSCSKTVNLKLRPSTPQLFIQGLINGQGSNCVVQVNRTVDFYASNDYPTVSGAIVKVSDNQGTADSLPETAPGVYTSRFIQGTPGNTYTLQVTINDTTYTAVSTMPQQVTPTDLTFSVENVLGQRRITPTIYFQDPPDIKNYYRFELSINGIPFTHSVYVFDDRLSDGRPINLDLQQDSSYIHDYDLIQVNMDCIDQSVYTFFNQLSHDNGNDPFNANASPSTPTSNFNNGAQGYFSAQTSSLISGRVP